MSMRAGRTQSRQRSAYSSAIAALDAASDDKLTIELDGAAVQVTNLDKVLWPAEPGKSFPEYTRRDYLRYLLRVAPYMLPHLRDRPLTLIRQPAGVTGRRFVHFHYEQPLPAFVETIDIYSENVRKAEQYLLCNNAATLIWLAHVGSLEFHAWHSRATAGPDAKNAGTDYASSPDALEHSVLNRPDYIVCDIDPYIYSGKERAGAHPEFNVQAWERCKEIALALKASLDTMKLNSLMKTSGRTGLHVLIPIVRTLTFEAARALAQTLGRHLMQQYPNMVTLDQRIAGRSGKLFFDYGMNARVKTLVAPYSVRGTLGAPVAMPVTWSELPRVNPFDFTMRNAADAVEKRGDIWRDILGQKQDIESALAALE